MNRIFSITLYTLLIISTARAQQVGVGTTQPDPSAALDISSSNKGLLIPRVDLGTGNIAAPATGLMVYNTNSRYSGGEGLFINLGTPSAPKWTQLATSTTNNFIRNQTGLQTNSNFNIAGNGSMNSLDVYGDIKATGDINASGDIKASGNFLIDMKYISEEWTIGGNSRSIRYLGCPAGYQLVSGGGGHRDFNGAVNDIRIAYNGPYPGNPSRIWRLISTNSSSSGRAMIIYCNCAKVK
jgi:hypothetical protein